jgi:hypothetical protein
MDVLGSEFSTAIDNAADRHGVVVPRDVVLAYQEKIPVYVGCMGFASSIMHCDGTSGFMAENLIPPAYESDKWWDAHDREMMLRDPAVGFALTWTRNFADSGLLPYYWARQKGGEKTAMDVYFDKFAENLQGHAGWNQLKSERHMPDGVERSVAKIAYAYFVTEDLPAYHAQLKTKVDAAKVAGRDPKSVFTFDRAPTPDPDRPNCGFLPFDDVLHGFANPAGILNAKGVYPLDPEITQGVNEVFVLPDVYFPENLAYKHPSEITLKDLERWDKLWGGLVGGSQGTNMADFTKLPEAIAAACNLYNLADYDTAGNIIPGKTRRADIIGKMIGDMIYYKVCAAMVASDENIFSQLSRVVQLGEEDTPAELAKVDAGILGAQGAGYNGALKEVRQFGLHIHTPKYNAAVAMLKTGIKDPTLAQVGRVGLALGAFLNRFTSPTPGSVSGKKKR